MPFKTELTLSVIRGLLYEISANLCEVYFVINNNDVEISFIFFKEPDDDDKDSAFEVMDSVSADFPDINIDQTFAVLTGAHRINNDRKIVFARRREVKSVDENG